mgnify:CR=1 FL=1
MLAQLPQRDDKAGQGHFGAKRGGQKHNGIDYACLPGTLILAPCDGLSMRMVCGTGCFTLNRQLPVESSRKEM